MYRGAGRCHKDPHYLFLPEESRIFGCQRAISRVELRVSDVAERHESVTVRRPGFPDCLWESATETPRNVFEGDATILLAYSAREISRKVMEQGYDGCGRAMPCKENVEGQVV